jgi:pimeloyl-ACP methyl ester carboxylesterase
MNGRVVLLLLFLGLVGVFSAPATKKVQRKRAIHGRPWFGLTPKPTVKGPLNPGVSDDQYIASKVDHFDSSNTNTYQQRYWYNDQWYSAGGPVFLMIGGESAEDSSWVADGDLVWTQLAAANNAMVFLIEHRYYGASQVTADQSTANLKYLSSRQALADIADFIPAMTAKFNLQGAKWVTFGGSYSGALAAWSRMLYPDLIYGAVGSSGPVQAVVDFVGYLEVVSNDLNTYSMDCGNSLKNALAQIPQLLTTSQGRQQLFKGFQLCQPLDQTNSDQIANFYSSIIGNYMTIAQYGGDNAGPFATEMTIPALCKLQTTSGNTDLQNMYAVNQWIMNYYGESCVDIDYNDYIAYLKQPGDYRAWIYQTCTEFGFYQSTDAPNAAFYGNVVPVDWYVKQCAMIYGSMFGNTTVYSNIASTNGFYHGQNGYNATRIVLPNGTNDPWHVLGVLSAPNSQAFPVIIKGTAHCADMYGDSTTDPASLTAARTQIRSIVNAWFQS